MITMGIDIGSTASKCVLLRDGAEIVAQSIIPVGTGTSGPQRAVDAVFGEAGLSRGDIACLAATGYGRNTFEGADMQVSELSCHAKGVCATFPSARTVIDIGGQDAKVIRLSPQGKMMKFLMNDKCAAGTGRFVSVMAKVLDVELEQMGELSEQSANRVEISSTCTVFAESEVISLLANRVSAADIAAAINRSVANRVGGLAQRLGVMDEVVMTGGVARNKGVVKALEAELGTRILVSPVAQLNGAYGAALYAYERAVGV